MTSSAGASGLILAASPPRSTIASRIVARSTTQGTPVKSCMITRAGVNWISVSGSACGSQAASARIWSAVMLAPSSVRSRFSSRTLRLNGSRSAPVDAPRAGRSRTSRSPTSSVPRAPKLSTLLPSVLLRRASAVAAPTSVVRAAGILPQHSRPRPAPLSRRRTCPSAIVKTLYRGTACPSTLGRWQEGDALDVVGHREQVEGAQARPASSRGPAEGADVAGQRGRVAGDVGDRPRRRAATSASTTGAPGAGPRRVEARPGRTGRPRAGAATRSTRPGMQPDGRAGRAGCGGRRARRRASASTASTRPPVAEVGRPARRRTARPRRTGRAGAPPAAAAARSRTASTSASAAPGCTCQKPGAVHPPVGARRACSAHPVDRPAATRRRPATTGVARVADGRGRPATLVRRPATRPVRAPPVAERRRGWAIGQRVQRARRRASGAGAARPAVGVDGEPHPGAPAEARRRRRAPASRLGLDLGTSSPASRRSCSRDDAALSARWAGEVDVLPVAPAAAARAGVRAAAPAPGRATARAPRPRRPRRNRDAVAALGDRGHAPARPAARAGRRRPGPRAGPRSGRRGRPRRPRARPSTGPSTRQRLAGVWTSTAPPARSAPAAAGRRRPVSARRSRLTRRDAATDGPVALGRHAAPRRAGLQLPRHAGHHHAGGEEQPGPQPQRALVVQQLLPPVPDDVLGDVDRHEVARAARGGARDVVEDRPGDLAVRRVEDLQRHRDLAPLPLLLQRPRLVRVDGDRDRLEGRRPGRPGVGEGPQRRLVDLGDQHDRVHPGRAASVGSSLADRELRRTRGS